MAIWNWCIFIPNLMAAVKQVLFHMDPLQVQIITGLSMWEDFVEEEC